MEAVWQWGIDLIIEIQKIRSPFLDKVFLASTDLGGTFFYILFIPFLYWCINEKSAAGLAIVFFFSFWLNSEFKDLLSQPRPYSFKPDIVIGHSSGYGLPSGHSQNSLVLWILLASWFKKKWLYTAAALLTLFISFSRLYLGHHFPTDIFGGWFLGIVVLLVYFGLRGRVSPWFSELKLSHKITASILIPGVLAFLSRTPWTVSSIALLSGFATGYLIMKTYNGFKAHGTAIQKLLRYLIGISGICIMYSAISVIIPVKSSPLYLPSCFLCFWLGGFWISAGAPWIFTRLKIADAELNIDHD